MKRTKTKFTALLLLLVLTLTAAMPVTASAASKRAVKISTAVKSGAKLTAGTKKALKVKTNTKSTLTYKTSNAKIVSIKSGKLTANLPGSATVTITAKPKSKSYKAASKKLTIYVIPAKPTAPKAQNAGGKLIINAKAVRGAHGYQYQYATNNKLKNTKNKTVKSVTYTANVNKNTTYYVRYRAYVKTGKKTLYGAWSNGVKVAKNNQPSHTHTWTPQYKTVKHPAETEEVWIEGEEVLVRCEIMCTDCGQTFWGENDWNDFIIHQNETGHGGQSAYGVYKTLPGHYETKTVKPAWNEKVLIGYKCDCGATKNKSNKKDKSNKKVKLNKTSVTLKKCLATVQLTANKEVTWSSSNKNVATVSSSGKVTSISNGKCTIKAKAYDGSYATCSVTVNFPDKPGTKVPTTHIVFDTWNLTMTKKGQTYKINPTVYPSNASNKNTITWSSSNPEIASVDKNGVITAHKYGSAIITATIVNYIEIINKNGDADLEKEYIIDDCGVWVNIPKEEAPNPNEYEAPKPPTPQKYDQIDLGGAFGNTSCPVQAISYLLTPGVLGDPIPEETLSSPTYPWALVPNGEALKDVTFELYGNKDCITTEMRLQPNERVDLRLKPVPLKEGKVTVVAKYNGNVIYVWDVNVHKTYPS